MARHIGLDRPEDVFSKIPPDLLVDQPPLGRSQMSQDAVLRLAAGRAARTRLDRPSFLGAGFYDRFVPPALIESILRRTDYYSAYTPYQAEASQGLLRGLFEYQQGICALTGLDVANASLYDGATALAEAVLCVFSLSDHPAGVRDAGAARTGGRGAADPAGTVLVSSAVHPYYRAVLKTYLADIPIRIVEVPFCSEAGQTLPAAFRVKTESPVVAIVAQNPNLFGIVEDMKSIAGVAADLGAGFVHVFEPTSLSILASPAEVGADIAVAEGQSLGLPLYYGGLALGVFAAGEKYLRRMPGRIVGQSVDADGLQAYCLTLQTREQHIRREKATSNICTNHTLCAIFAGAYLRLLGFDGLQSVVETAAARLEQFVDGIRDCSFVKPLFRSTALFEIAVRSDKPMDHLPVLPLGRFYPGMDRSYLVSFTERRTPQDVDWLIREIKSL